MSTSLSVCAESSSQNNSQQTKTVGFVTAGQCAVTDVCSVIVLKAESDLPEECNDGGVTFSDKRGLGRTFTFSLCFGLKSAFAKDFRVKQKCWSEFTVCKRYIQMCFFFIIAV